ncbi:MAG: hypothetical protein NUV81_03325 [bacterium]|nr:hypothetical protein [bacterium]
MTCQLVEDREHSFFFFSGCLTAEALDRTGHVAQASVTCGEMCATDLTWSSQSDTTQYGSGEQVYWFEGTPDRVFRLGWNMFGTQQVIDWDEPAWGIHIESDYHRSDGVHLAEWHVSYLRHRWNGQAWTSTTRKPISAAVNRDDDTQGVSLRGEIKFDDSTQQKNRMKLQDRPPGQMAHAFWYDVTHSWYNQSASLMSYYDGPVEVPLMSYQNGAMVLRGRVRIETQAPVVQSCDDLITALANMGLVIDGR